MSEPSRANTRDDCGSWMICHASPVLCVGSCATTELTEPSARINEAAEDRRRVIAKRRYPIFGWTILAAKGNFGQAGDTGGLTAVSKLQAWLLSYISP